jgi:hypothetical protein
VGGGAGDAVITGQRVRAGPVAEPAQPQDRVPEAGQCPATPAGCRRGAVTLVVGALLQALHANVLAVRLVRLSVGCLR